MTQSASPAPAATPIPAEPAAPAPVAAEPAAEPVAAAPAVAPVEPAAPAAAAPAKLAPEKYEFKHPDGAEFDAEVLTEFEGAARELDLPQDKAQLLIDKLAPKIAARQQANLEAAFENAKANWAAEARADKDIGGERFDENVALAKQAVETFGGTEFKQFLDQTGLGNHPAMLRTFVGIHKALGPDYQFVGGNARPSGPGTPEQVMYPSMAKA